MTVNVLFVCLGNICRSPTAHGVFEQLVSQHQLADKIFTDSAGTSNWHIGGPPDQRSALAAGRRGYDLSALRARQICTQDFSRFDYILAMDQQNLMHLRAMSPDDYAGVLTLFLDFAAGNTREVPDPYYGSGDGFETVLDLVEQASKGLLMDIQSKFLKS